MTTSNSISRLLGAALLLLPCVTLAQDSDPDEERARRAHQLRLCPELAQATGRERDQLRALFFEFHPRKLTLEESKRVRTLFSLGSERDVALLSRALESEQRVRCMNGLLSTNAAPCARVERLTPCR